MPIFKKSGGRIFGVQFNAKEQKALDTAIHEQLLADYSFNWLWLLIPVGVLALGGCGYAGYKGYRHYINKKRGYAA